MAKATPNVHSFETDSQQSVTISDYISMIIALSKELGKMVMNNYIVGERSSRYETNGGKAFLLIGGKKISISDGQNLHAVLQSDGSYILYRYEDNENKEIMTFTNDAKLELKFKQPNNLFSTLVKLKSSAFQLVIDNNTLYLHEITYSDQLDKMPQYNLRN